MKTHFRDSITLYVDGSGLVNLSQSLKICLHTGESEINLDEESKILSKKVDKIRFSKAIESRLEAKNNTLSMCLDEEDLDYFIFKAKLCAEEKGFYPAEIISFPKKKKKNKQTEIYLDGVFEENNEENR